ncbi:MAG: sugar phosphate isomerase/epimerase family protein [Candidatus Altiarchaeota archaeon]|nr:sugar phosphate isomerase/epimerase family protein [Candidatus Altiarchaeota archaeon]
MKIGVNSQLIKEISDGPIQAKEVELIELSMKHSNVLNGTIDYGRLKEIRSLGTRFTVHAPYAKNGQPGVDLGIRQGRNIEIMEKVFEITSFLDAEYVVIHGDKVNGDYRKSFLNLIHNLTQLTEMAEEYQVTLLLENLHKENGFDRMGILPHEILQAVELVNKENLKIVFDVGHGNLTASLYKFDILEFLDYLSPYIHHMHIHDNLGIPATVDERYGDQHLPLGQGVINFNRIFRRIQETKTKNLILELKTKSREEALKSIEILKELRDGELRRYNENLGFISVKKIGEGIVNLNTPPEAIKI